MVNSNHGCSYGKVNRQMIVDIKEDLKDIKAACVDLSNHYSRRIQPWVVTIISILTGLLGIVAGIAFS